MLDGMPKSVTENLRSFLVRCCDEQVEDGHTVIFWVDTLYIDQHALEEKGKQIKLMKQIHNGAAQVVVWLDLGGA